MSLRDRRRGAGRAAERVEVVRARSRATLAGAAARTRATPGITPRAVSAARVAAGMRAAARAAAPVALSALPPAPSRRISAPRVIPLSWICSSFSSPFSSSVTPAVGLPKRKPSQPPGLTSSRICLELVPLVLGHADALPRLERVLLGERQDTVGGIGAVLELLAVVDAVAVGVGVARVAAERDLLAVGQPVAVDVGVVGDRVVAVEDAVAVGVDLRRVLGRRAAVLARDVADQLLHADPDLRPGVRRRDRGDDHRDDEQRAEVLGGGLTTFGTHPAWTVWRPRRSVVRPRSQLHTGRETYAEMGPTLSSACHDGCAPCRTWNRTGAYYTRSMPSDAQLLARISSDATGEALRTLYRAYAGELYGFALNALGDRGTAEEVVQEVFTRAWRHAEAYDPTRGSVRTWLYQIARHAIIDSRRRAAVRPALALHEPRDEQDPEGLSIERAMLGWQVAGALEKLTPEHRQVIRLAHVQGLSVREIAERLGLPEGTVKSRTWYALRSLRLVLEEMGVRA